MNCAALFPSGGAAVGFVLSSTAHAGKLLGMKYHCDFYLCQNWERLADRLKKNIMETDRQRHLHTASYGTELFFQKKKKWTQNENGQSLSRSRCGYELLGSGLMDSLWRQTALLRLNEQ